MITYAVTKKLLLSVIAIILGVTSHVYGCGCGSFGGFTFDERLLGGLETSTSVFSGTVVGFEYRKNISNDFADGLIRQNPLLTYETKVVKFEVNRWWKMPLRSTVYLLTKETRLSDGSQTFSDCDFRFNERENYVVFADGTSDGLTTNLCSMTLSLKQQTVTPVSLGPGNEPKN